MLPDSDGPCLVSLCRGLVYIIRITPPSSLGISIRKRVDSTSSTHRSTVHPAAVIISYLEDHTVINTVFAETRVNSVN